VDWPSFIAIIALVALLVVVRLLIFSRWRSYRLSHRQAAALYASVAPLVILASFAIMGIPGLAELVFYVGLALFAFGSTYVIAVFFLRAFGGEMDPPASRGYRRRP
jgi:hypothetical protein